MCYTITQTRAQPMGAHRGGAALALTLEVQFASGKGTRTLQLPLAGQRPTPNNPKPQTKAELTLNPPRADVPGLQEITPSLWVAFASPLPPSTMSEGIFTHFVEIAYPGPAARRNRTPSHLPLILPHSESRKQDARLRLALTIAQLHSALGFLMKVLPPDVDAHLDGSGGVRVLVTVPPGRAADALSVVGGYLALVEGCTVDDAMQCDCIDEEMVPEHMCKAEVSWPEVEKVERVVKEMQL